MFNLTADELGSIKITDRGTGEVLCFLHTSLVRAMYVNQKAGGVPAPSEAVEDACEALASCFSVAIGERAPIDIEVGTSATALWLFPDVAQPTLEFARTIGVPAPTLVDCFNWLCTNEDLPEADNDGMASAIAAYADMGGY